MFKYEAVRSSGIRLLTDQITAFNIKKDLTITQYDYITGDKHTIHCYKEKPPYLWIPRHYPLSISVKNNFIPSESIEIESNIEPRDDIQFNAINTLSKDLQDITLKLPPGYGKTVITIASIAKLKRKALVLVDQTDLAKQWCNAINKFTNLNVEPDIKASFKYTISVVTIQKLLVMIRKNPIELWKLVQSSKIGIVVFDEVHALIGPEQFTFVCFALPVQKMIFVSATPYRLDESGKIFKYWTGDRIFSADQLFKVKVLTIFFRSNIPQKTWKWITWSSKTFRVRYNKQLTKSSVFINAFKSIMTYIQKEQRKVLFLVERIDTVEVLHKVLDEMGIEHGLYYADKNRDQLEHNVIIATYKKCTKAIDIPHIDTLVYLTPISNEIALEQSKGRIQRKADNKKDPLIIDLVDIDSHKNMSAKDIYKQRKQFYEASGFTIEEIDYQHFLEQINSDG